MKAKGCDRFFFTQSEKSDIILVEKLSKNQRMWESEAMKKRIWIAAVAALLAAALIFVLLHFAGQPVKVGICYRDSADASNSVYRAELEQALKKAGAQLVVTDADADQSKQLSQIERLAQSKCQVLILEPVMTGADQQLKTALAQLGLPVVLCGREVPELESLPQTVYIGAQQQDAGALLAETVLQLPNGADLNGDGVLSYLLLCGPEDHRTSLERADAAVAALSGVQTALLQRCTGEDTVDSGRKLCRQELANYGKDIEVILCTSDAIAVGAAQAIADGGRTVGKDVYLLGIDGDEQALDMVAAGTMTATVFVDPAAQAQTVAQAVLGKLKGNEVSHRQVLPFVAVTAENVKDYLP